MNRTHIILHCSDSPQGRGDNAETIHRWHKENGFDGIGYHFVILENGAIESGRPLFWDGAHTRGFNNKSIGICMIGKDTFTDEQIESAKSLINSTRGLFNIPIENILGHYETEQAHGKTCPNYDMELFRNGL